MSAIQDFAISSSVAQPQASVQEMKKPKVSKAHDEAKKPIKYISEFTSKYIAVKRMGKNKEGKTVVKKHAPKILSRSYQDLDTKSNQIDIKLKEIQDKIDQLPISDSASRETLKKEQKKLATQKANLYKGIIDINRFKFVKDFDKSNGDINNVTDPELRGYLEILNKSKQIDQAALKDLIDRFEFKNESKFLSYVAKFNEILKDEETIKTLIFNNTFEHPVMIGSDGKPVIKKIGKKQDGKQEYQYSYLVRSYKYFDTILATLVEGKNTDENILAWVIDQEIKNNPEIAPVKQGEQVLDVKTCMQAIKLNDAAKLKGRREKKLLAIYNKTANLIKILKTYPKLAANFNDYMAAIEIYNQAKSIEIKSTDIASFLGSVVSVLSKLHQIKIIGSAKKEIKYADGIDVKLLDRFVKASDVQFCKDTKTKLIQCAQNGKQIVVLDKKRTQTVKNEKGEDIIKVVPLEYFEFTQDEFEKMDQDKDFYSSNRYSKLGSITQFTNATKTQKVALGLRLVSELKRIIPEMQLEGQQTLIIAC